MSNSAHLQINQICPNSPFRPNKQSLLSNSTHFPIKQLLFSNFTPLAIKHYVSDFAHLSIIQINHTPPTFQAINCICQTPPTCQMKQDFSHSTHLPIKPPHHLTWALKKIMVALPTNTLPVKRRAHLVFYLWSLKENKSFSLGQVLKNSYGCYGNITLEQFAVWKWKVTFFSF